jgi:diphthamide biosynthesis methyltransferase
MYDPRCEELARVFLDDYTPVVTEAELESLAQAIQDAIESHLRMVDEKIAQDVGLPEA